MMDHDFSSSSYLTLESDKEDHYDWCQSLTERLDLRLFPKVFQQQIEYHEVMAVIFPDDYYFSQDDKKLVKEIIKNSPETRSVRFFEPKNKEALFVHFLVKHTDKKNSTVTGFLNTRVFDYEQIFIKTKFLEAKKGKERWLFSAPDDVLNDVKKKILHDGLGQVEIISEDDAKNKQLQVFRNFYDALGATEEQSRILSTAKYHGLLDNMTNPQIRSDLLCKYNMKDEKFSEILNGGIFSCSWVNGITAEMKQKISI